jgi:CubicO group peptidase (beta-lactamase class C family)
MSKSIESVALERRVDALFSRYTRPGSPGAVAAVMRGGDIELCKGYGLASIELGVPIGPRTRFPIASVSKQFTTSAALMLAEEGKLKLSDSPHKYLGDLESLPVTIDQMMRNASGLPDFLERRGLGGQCRRATDRGQRSLAGARHRRRHGRDRIAGQLAPGDPARPSGARPHRPRGRPRSIDRPHQEAAVRACCHPERSEGSLVGIAKGPSLQRGLDPRDLG